MDEASARTLYEHLRWLIDGQRIVKLIIKTNLGVASRFAGDVEPLDQRTAPCAFDKLAKGTSV